MRSCLTKNRFLGYEIIPMVWLILSAIHFPAVSYAKDKNPGFLPIKNYPVIADPESISWLGGYQFIGEGEGIRLGEVKLQLFNDPLLNGFRSFEEFFAGGFGEVVVDHYNFAFAFTDLPLTLPDRRDLSREIRKEGLLESISSLTSSRTDLPSNKASVLPCLSTIRVVPSKEKGIFDLRERLSKTTFSSASVFNNDGAIL